MGGGFGWLGVGAAGWGAGAAGCGLEYPVLELDELGEEEELPLIAYWRSCVQYFGLDCAVGNSVGNGA